MIADEPITQLTADVLEALIGSRPSQIPPPPQRRVDFLAGAVKVRGPWCGTIAVFCSPQLARRVAEAMLEVSREKASPDDLRDVLGELANVLGGNVKSVLPGPSHLSLPFTEVVERGVQTGDSEFWFALDGEPLVLKLQPEGST